MTSLNRKIHPEFKSIDQVNIPEPKEIILDNGLKTFIFDYGTQDVLKIDLVFNAGSWFQDKALTAAAVNEMLIEGTKNRSSNEIAEKLDYYGAFIQPGPSKDFASITLYTLNKYLTQTIDIFRDVILNPSFPEKELKTYLSKRKQQFLIEQEKVTNIARTEFNEQLFGNNHPYGKRTEVSDYENLTRNDLVSFHREYYKPNNAKLIVSGKVNNNTIDLINKNLGSTDWAASMLIEEKEFVKTETPKPFSAINKENVTQSAIRIGKIIINKDHEDFHKLKIVNTILGGYFGSRLMKKIREEKGYTYGIGSALVTMKHEAFMVILTEVGKDVTKNAIEDIFGEIHKLRTEIVTNDELETVKNYMMGDLIRSFDGAFEIASAYRSIIDFDLEKDYLQKAINTIQQISQEEIQLIANKYLNEESFIKTIAGKYD